MPDDSLTPDELASALLDQEVATPAHVDPALAARVEQFGAVAAQVGASVPVDPDRRDQAIAAALAEFDAGRGDGITAAAPAAPTPLRPRRPVALRLLGAAAAVVIALGAVTLLRRDETRTTDTAAGAATTAQGEGGGSERLPGTSEAGEDTATAAESAPTSQAPGLAAGAAPETANDAAAPPPVPTSAPRDLGEVDTAVALQSQLGLFAASDDADSTAPSAICVQEARAASTLALGDLVDSATLRWQDRPARALVFATTDSSGTAIIVMSDPSCEVLGQIS